MDAVERERLIDMLDYARDALGILGSSEVHAVEADKAKLFALSYAILVIGEAASAISPDTRGALSNVPWPKAIGMRHRLVHGYRARNVETIVKTVRDDLPALIGALESALEDGGT